MDENRITGQIIGAAIEVHRMSGPGLPESTDQQCLAREFELRGIPFRRELDIGLDYRGLVIGRAYWMDFLVLDRLVVEVKTVEAVLPVHRSQLLAYRKWSDTRLGLLINFNIPLLKSGIYRVANSE